MHPRVMLCLPVIAGMLGLSCGGGSGGGSGSGNGASNGNVVVPGATRIGWDQAAADATELARLHFAIYIDDRRSELPSASCSGPAGSSGFSCAATLPSMASGQHAIQIAAYIQGDVLLESAKSAPLVVTVSSLGAATAGAAIADAEAPSPRVTAPSSVRDAVTRDGTTLHTAVAAAIPQPAALAVAADGTLVIGDRTGSVTVVRAGAAPGATALDGEGVLDLVLDPQFERSHVLYVLDTVPGDPATFRLARYRELDGRLGERAVLFDGVPASPAAPSGAVAFGTDGRLYLALDDGGDAERASRPSSYNGKVMRLSIDGRIPADQSASTPVYAANIHSPRSLAWDASSASLWLADAAAPRATRLRTREGRATATAVRLPLAQGPASVAVYRGALIPALAGNLLVTSVDGGPSILRLRMGGADADTVSAAEPLTLLGSGSIHTVKVGPDGAIYALTDDAVLRVTPR